MKVYVFTFHQAVDGEFLGIDNQVFENREDAIRAFKEWRDDEIKSCDEAGWQIGTDVEDHFEAYLLGYYAGDHSEGFVNEYDIK